MNGTSDPVRSHYRIAWRAMAANTGERTLIPSLIPPGAAHINGVFCVGGVVASSLLGACGFAGSLAGDCAVRVVPKSGIYQGVFERLPVVVSHELSSDLILRVARLNCLVTAYAQLWAQVWSPSFAGDSWVGGRARDNRPSLEDVHAQWTWLMPLRIAEDRRQAQLETDAIVAVMLGVTADELCTVYRTQFPVLHGYDTRRDYYDINGRIVPTGVVAQWRRQGEESATYSATHPGSGIEYTYQTPFRLLDREADLRLAYSEFGRRLHSRSENTV